MLTGNNNAHIIIIISVVITVNHCKFMLLYSPLNMYTYQRVMSLCTLDIDFKSILL